MSGLCGVVDLAAPIDRGNLRIMAESSSYRAPGGIGYLFLKEAGLAYQALQTPSAGASLDQPLLEPRHQVCLAMDGRFDNRSDLIGRLDPADGQSTSDAGLLLAAYLEWGVECTDHLLGDFAFAVWDAPRKRLFCAVDAMGIKPLHYAQVGSLLVFASDAIQVLLHPAVPEDYNEQEIAAYLDCRSEDPEQSFFAAIHKLGPARRLIVENGNLHVERYWSPEPGEIRYPRDEDYEDRFREIFQRSVADRLRDRGDFAGVAMSGGLDSTSVAACSLRAAGSSGARAYSYVFQRLAECDEQSYSRAMTEELGLEVEPVAVEAVWRMESQGELPVSADTPFTGWRSCTAEIFRRMAAAGSRVLLTGHGGDDLMRGSSLVYAERLRRGDLGAVREVLGHARSQRSSLVRALYRHFGRPHMSGSAERVLRRALGLGAQELSQPWIEPDFARRARRDGRQPAGSGGSPSRRAIHAKVVGTPWYWRLANWHDRNSASFGIEVRHPFLDRRLVEYVLALPGEQLFRLGSSKSLLRRAMRGVLPESIRLRAGKTRFTSFIDFVLLERSAGEIVELLREPRSANLGILDGDALRSAYQSLVQGGPDAPRRAVWYAINLEIWLRRCEAVLRSRQGGLRAGGRVAA